MIILTAVLFSKTQHTLLDSASNAVCQIQSVLTNPYRNE